MYATHRVRHIREFYIRISGRESSLHGVKKQEEICGDSLPQPSLAGTQKWYCHGLSFTLVTGSYILM